MILHVKPRDCREREVSVVLCLSRVFYLVLALIMMPPKNKRQKQSESALAIGREKLVRLMSGSSDHNVSDQQDASPASTSNTANVELGVADLLSPTDAPVDDDETVDPTFDMDASVSSDTDHQRESFVRIGCCNWIETTGCLWVFSLSIT